MKKTSMIAVALSAVAPLFGHICPGQGGGYFNSHDAARTKLTGKQVQSMRSAAKMMKQSVPVDSGTPAFEHDAPIVISSGSVKVNFGYSPESSGGLLRHGCPGDHIVEINTWSRGPVKPGVSTAKPVLAQGEQVKLWFEKKQAKGFTMSQTNAPADMTLSLIPSGKAPGDMTWQLSGPGNSPWQTSPAGGSDYMVSEQSTPPSDVRLAWIQVGSAPPVSLRGQCFAIQIYHSLVGPNSDADIRPWGYDKIAPPCAKSIGPSTESGPAHLPNQTDKIK